MLDISEVARRSGLPASTLRFYEERGVISSLGRRGLRRTFDASVLTDLALITLARAAGFTLAEIGNLLGPGKHDGMDRSMLARKADELDAAVARLSIMRDELRRAAACPAETHLACPNFQRRLVASPEFARRRRRGSRSQVERS